jgi:hypothetical protein
MPHEYLVTLRRATGKSTETELTTPTQIRLNEPPSQGDKLTFTVADVYEEESPPRIVVELEDAATGIADGIASQA